jgi:Response regulator containing a CheY-like receiver domain and a GGDEF domain
MAVRILVVDADPTVQRALGNALSQAGFEVTTSGEGPEALRLARSDRPALVLIAANLPGVDGFTVVSRLRMEDGPSTHTPAILLLPENDAEARSKALRWRRRLSDQAFPSGRVDGAYAQPAGAV